MPECRKKNTITLFNTAATNGIIHNRAEDERQNKNNNNVMLCCYDDLRYEYEWERAQQETQWINCGDEDRTKTVSNEKA